VVNTTDDVDDLACDAAHCSLREAIICANENLALDHITFNIPHTDPAFTGAVWLISPDSALPALTDDGIIVDGPSQATNQGDTNPDGPEVVVSGVDAGAANGFSIQASDCVIRGLNIGGFELDGVLIAGAGASNNTIEYNYIGTAANGSATFANGQSGVTIWSGAQHNTVGPGNLLSGNGMGGPIGIGVRIFDSDHNTVTGNYIGTDASGGAPLPNTRNGMEVTDCQDTVIEGNLISGNTYSGVKMFVVENSHVRGNIIGLNAGGTAPVPNEGEGLIIEDAAANVTVGPDNVISGNTGNGMGLKDPEVHDITILGNYIGTDATGTIPMANGANGIQVFDRVYDVTIGPDNVIAYNGANGIYLFDGAHDNTIGPDNVIAYNSGDGVRVDGQDTLYNTITQNSITENGTLGIENINGGNTELPPPAITGFTATEASGTAILPGGAPCAGCTIEVFSDPNGEGRQYLGSGNTLGDGSWTVAFTEGDPLYARLTATSTDTDGNTSEFPLRPVDFLIPDVEVDKELTDPPGGVAGVLEDVTFRITIRNTGDTTLTEIRVTDGYPAECLEFVTSDPFPNEVDDTPPLGELIWYDVTDHFGDLDPDDEAFFSLHFRAIAPCELEVNCVVVDAEDRLEHHVDDGWCEDVSIVGLPPEIEVSKVAVDPVVCVGDVVEFYVFLANSGPVPIATVLMTDTYDTTYLASLNDEAAWGPDDGELVMDVDVTADWGWPPLALGEFMSAHLTFLAEAETPSTVDEFRAMVNDDPATERSDTATVTILPEPGPCEGNLVTNGGFEDEWTGWMAGFGAPRIAGPGHSGDSSLLLGILPDEPDAGRYDIAMQDVDIPADAHEAWITFWVNVGNEDPDIGANVFVANVISMDGAAHNMMETVDSHGWRHALADLTPYIGETVRLMFGAANNGDGVGPLWAYVDDVEICVSRCGPEEPPDPPPVPDPPPDGPPEPELPPDRPPVTCWNWKATWPDYAPNGMPDFDQHGYYTDTFTLTVDGPAASANSLWWFDSEFNGTITPDYPLVESYGDWDDHDPQNVPPLILDLAERMQTDGFPDQPGDWIGTRPDDLANGIRDLLEEKDLLDDYSVTLEASPSYYLIRDEVLRCEDVLLLLGFWEHQPEGWRRLGGHWVNGAGVDCADQRLIAISDPFIDSAERGYAGTYLPITDHETPHDWRLHDDAVYLSHDLYWAWIGREDWGLVNYIRRDPVTREFYPDFLRFWEANTPREFEEIQAEEYQYGPIRVVSEYMVAVSPLTDTVTLSLVPSFVEALVGEVFVVDVMAESRTQPFDTVQVYLDFDPTLLQCVDAAGNPITETIPISPTLVLQNEVDNEAGQVNYAARVAFGDPPLTGRVQVIRLYFQSIAPTAPEGTPLEFNWTTPRRTDILSEIISVLGRIAEAQVRAAGDPATIQASVTLQGRPTPPHELWEIPLTVELRSPATDTTWQIFAPSTDDQGRFTIEGAMPGTYDLRVKGMHTLANRWSELELVAGDNAVDLGELVEGDADNDNDVDGTDASLVNLAFGSVPGDANWDPRADFNEDETINGVDMGLLAANFGLLGDVEVSPTSHVLRPTSHASRFTFHASRFTFHALRFTSPITITFSPTPITADVNDIFTVDVVIQAGPQPVDTVEAHIYFPAGVLRLVDAGGNPAATVEGGAAFDLELANSADNSAGKIHYAATMLGSSLSGDITVATLRFKAIRPTMGSWLRFQVWPPEKTDVSYLGQSVLTAWPAASVTVEGYPKIYLPLILKSYS